jgi:hypothetical protein
MQHGEVLEALIGLGRDPLAELAWLVLWH